MYRAPDEDTTPDVRRSGADTVMLEDGQVEDGIRAANDPAQAPRPSELTQVTRAMVAIYKEQFGRGPKHAHSHFASADSIVCFLEGSLTPVERTLAAIGEDQRLRDIRLL